MLLLFNDESLKQEETKKSIEKKERERKRDGLLSPFSNNTTKILIKLIY